MLASGTDCNVPAHRPNVRRRTKAKKYEKKLDNARAEAGNFYSYSYARLPPSTEPFRLFRLTEDDKPLAIAPHSVTDTRVDRFTKTYDVSYVELAPRIVLIAYFGRMRRLPEIRPDNVCEYCCC